MDDVLYTLHVLNHEPAEPSVFSPREAQNASRRHEGCVCRESLQLAQAYVPPQPLDGIFTPEEALRRGTAFPNLYQPYHGWESRISAASR